MTDYDRTIDNIRSMLATDLVSEQQIVTVAAEYAEACETVNARLRKCKQLLRQGMRSEALHQAEAEPELLGLVAALDIPESAEWNELLVSAGLPGAAKLLMDVAIELNEAYAQEQPLAAQLRRHRLQALSHSPLGDRIATLRQIAVIDADNPLWQQDLHKYEQARHQEIHEAAERAAAKGNTTGLESLIAELKSADWLEKPPKALVEKVCKAHAISVRQQAQSSLENLAPQLNDAFAQFDAQHAFRLRDEWSRNAALVGLTDDNPLHEHVAPALEWLERYDQERDLENRFEAAVQDLEQSLDNEDGMPILERHVHNLLRYDRPLPANLEYRVQSRITALKSLRKRRMQMLATALGVVVVLAGSGIAYSVLRHNHERQVTQSAGMIGDLIERNMLSEVDAEFRQLRENHPRVWESLEIQDLHRKYSAAVQSENARKMDFQRYMERAENAGFEKPDREAAELAQNCARTPDEKERLHQFLNQLAARDLERLRARDEELQKRLSEFKRQLDKLNPQSPDATALEQFRRELQDLGEGGAHGPLVQLLRERVDSLLKQSQWTRGLQDLCEKLDSSVGNLASYQGLLEEFGTHHLGTEEAENCNSVLMEIPLWGRVDAWNQLGARWEEEDWRACGGKQAQELLGTCNTLLSEHGDYPDVDSLKRRIGHLEAITRRIGNDGTKLHTTLRDLFTDKLVAVLWMLQATDPKTGADARYYLTEQPPIIKDTSRKTIVVNYITDFNRSDTKSASIPIDSIQYREQYRDPAPQSKLADKVMAALDEYDTPPINKPKAWEATFHDIIRNVANEEHLEPVLRVVFLKQVLEIGSQGSELIRSAYQPYRDVLGSVGIDPAVTWMDPKSQDAIRMRGLAEGLLKRLPKLKQSEEALVKAAREFRTPWPRYEWVGWLNQFQGAQECRLKKRELSDGTPVYIAKPASGGKSMIWLPIAKISQGKVVFQDVNDTAWFVNGRAVFVRR